MVQGPVQMLTRIPPKYAVAEAVGYLKGKVAISVARQFRQATQLQWRDSARGYGVNDGFWGATNPQLYQML